MGKQSKNGSSSGGDERIMYNRRYKSSSNASKTSTNENLAKKVNNLDSSSRSKNSGTLSQPSTNSPKSISKSKLRSPIKPGLGQSTNRADRPNSENKEVPKVVGTSKANIQLPRMKQETAGTEQIPVNMQGENKEVVESIENKLKESINPEAQPSLAHQENGDSNGVHKNGASSEDNHNENKNGQIDINEDECLDINEKGEFKLQLEAEENCLIIDQILESSSIEESLSQFNQTPEESGELKSDSETYSVDVVESTTSEIPEGAESTLPSENKEKINENDDLNSEVVKDVSVEAEDHVKITEIDDDEEAKIDQSSPEYLHRDTTFGKTLRTISGRHSIGRMRHITGRDKQPSPNSSLFVNTSSASISEPGSSPRRLRSHRSTPTAELNFSNNGTDKVLERKRKIIEESADSQKKVKTEEEKSTTSFLNSSFELLKMPFRRSTADSTPKKSETESIEPTGGELVKYGEPIHKKWCSIM